MFVPANAGTHNHREELLERLESQRSQNNFGGYGSRLSARVARLSGTTGLFAVTTPFANSSRPMSMRRISLVPAPIS